MKRYWWLLVALLVLTALLAKVSAVLAQSEERFYSQGVGMVSGGWAYGSRPLGVLTSKGWQLTGYAFGPGRAEVALCGRAGDTWGLWKAAVSPIAEARQARQQRLSELIGLDWRSLSRGELDKVADETSALQSLPYDRSKSPPHLLWAAPEGVELRGPVWWAPDGTVVLVRALRNGAADLVAIDDMTGQATWLTEGKTVSDVAWPATSHRMAFVTEDHGARTVWIRDSSGTREAGAGGYDLRWSPQGDSLRWLRPSSSDTWAEIEWDAAAGDVQQVGTKPARPDGASWSPDGRWCAAVTKGKLMLWPAASSRGETVPLTDIVPQRVLGWSPDSNLLLLLGDKDHVFVVAVAPPPTGAYIVDRTDVQARVLELNAVRVARPWPFLLSAGAGDPSWSSDGRMLAYAARSDTKPESAAEVLPEGELFVVEFDRQYLEVSPQLTPEIERIVALQNIKNVALALNMYLTDYDRFPPVAEQQPTMWILDEYVRNRSVFMRPGKPEEMVVQWKFSPEKSTVDYVDVDVSQEIVAIIDYSPDFYAVAYLDGHARLFEKHP